MINFKSNIVFEKYRHLVKPKTILGMTSENELGFLRYFASKIYQGEGDILDMGCLFGATTEALAEGLAQNERVIEKNNRIYAYDLFYWEQSLSSLVKNTVYENRFKEKDDYTQIFIANTSKYESYIQKMGNACKFDWYPKPIEFIFIDAMKNLSTTEIILKSYYPHLIPGKSFLVYQDFDHYLTPWVHLLIYLHRKHCKHVHDIPPSGGTVFKYVKKLPDELLRLNFYEINQRTADAAFKYSFGIAHKNKFPNIAAAHIMFYIFQKQFDKARYLLSVYLNKGHNPHSDLQYISELLKVNG